ncbi:MAG: hypothetical protein SNG27_08100 [Rikenellaceae bacterium]
MEATVKFNIIEGQESDWAFDSYANGKIQNLTGEDLTAIIKDIIREVIINNIIYYDIDDIENATQEVLPTISSIILNPQFCHLRANYDSFVEFIAYLVVRLA